MEGVVLPPSEVSTLEYGNLLQGRPVTYLPYETIRYIICKEFGWDYVIFSRQPPEFISEIMAHLSQEGRVAQQAQQERRLTSQARSRPGERYT
jgi:hypothetical protein